MDEFPSRLKKSFQDLDLNKCIVIHEISQNIFDGTRDSKPLKPTEIKFRKKCISQDLFAIQIDGFGDKLFASSATIRDAILKWKSKFPSSPSLLTKKTISKIRLKNDDHPKKVLKPKKIKQHSTFNLRSPAPNGFKPHVPSIESWI